MRRPPIGKKIMRGMKLLVIKNEQNLDHGFIPFQWTWRDLNDARRALQYMEDMVDWHAAVQKSHEDDGKNVGEAVSA